MSFTTYQGSMPPGPTQSGPASGTPAAGTPGRLLLPTRARRRQPGLAAAGIVLTVGGAAISAALVLNAGNTVSVLTVVRDVPAGVALERTDLGIAQVAGSGVSAIRAGKADVVIGRTTLSAIPKGTLLNSAMVSDHPVPGAGEVAVGIVLPPGNIPNVGLAGRAVTVYRLVSSKDTGQTSTVLVPRAMVISAEYDRTGTGKILLTLVTERSAAAAVLQAAADEEVGLALLPVGS